MAGVNAYKDGVVGRLYKGLQGLVKARKITYVEGEGTAGRAEHRRGRRPAVRRAATSSWPPAPTRKTLPGLEIDGERVITSEHALTPRPRARLRDRPRRRRDRLRVRQRLEVLRRRRDHRRGAAPAASPPRTRPARRRSSGRSASAASHFKVGKPFEKVERTDDRRDASTIEGGETFEAELLLVAVGRGPTTAEPRLRGAGRRDGPRLRDHRRAAAHQRAPTSTRSATSCPACSSRTAASPQGIFVAEEIAGLQPGGHRRGRHPPGHLLRPRGRLGRPDRGQGPGEVRRRQDRDRTTTTSAATARARSSRPRASSSWSG